MEVHSFVPRFQSLRWAIATAINSRPFDRFVVPGFPSGITTSPTQAVRIARFLSRYFRDFPQPIIHLYEVGAGAGTLGIHVMDALKATEFYLYQMVTWHVVDTSRTRVEAMRKNPMMHRHAHKICIEDGDVRDIPDTADGIILSTVLSMMPARHVIVENGICHEAIIRSKIDSELEWTDTSVYPAVTRYADAVTHSFQTSIDDLIPDAERILKHLTEEWALVHASEDTGWHPKELDLANLWAQNNPDNAPFNCSGLVAATIRESVQKVTARNGFVLIEDIAMPDQGDLSITKLMVHYKSSCGFRIPFGRIAQWIGVDEHRTVTTHFRDSDLQIQLILPTGHSLKSVEFHSLFPDLGNESTTHLLRNLRTIKDADEYLAVLEAGKSTLHPESLEDYDFNLCVGLDLVARKREDEAISYIDTAIQTMGPVGIMAHWVRALIHRHRLEHDAANGLLQQLLSVTVYPPAVSEWVRVLQDTGKSALAAEIAGRYYAHLGSEWHAIAISIGDTPS